MIKIENISYKYSGSPSSVFDGLSLSFEEGKIYGLLGKNGVGKSTLLYLLSGLLLPVKGRIEVDGFEPSRREPSLMENVFFVPDEFLLPNMSLARYVQFYGKFYPRFSQEIFDACLQDFELTDVKKIGQLSLGQKKRLLVSFALATQCRVLLMDEPTNGLDIPAKSLFRRLVARHMAEDQTIIISTHQVHDVDALLDHIVIMGPHPQPVRKEGETGAHDADHVLLNASIADLQEQYAFQYRTMNEPFDDALYLEPTPQGRAVIVKNTTNEETTVNVELLFNAVVKGKLAK